MDLALDYLQRLINNQLLMREFNSFTIITIFAMFRCIFKYLSLIICLHSYMISSVSIRL